MAYPAEYGAPGMRDEPPGTEGSSQFKAFVGGLSYQINSDDLRKAFERYDSVSAEVMTDKMTGRPRGFGFVYFKDEQGLKDAIDQMHEKELEGRRISVTRAVPQDQTKPGTPAAHLGGGAGARREWGERRGGYPRDSYDRGAPARGYERGGYGGYDRGYGGGGGYDPRYAYDRGGYDRGYGGSGGYGGSAAADGYTAAASQPSSGYDRREPYADPYGRSGSAYGGYGGAYYDDRSGYGSGAYDYGRTAAYDDRGAGGPDRRGYAAPRASPYDRPPDRRVSEPPRR